MARNRLDAWVFSVTLGALLFFQGILWLVVPAGSQPAVVILGAGMDAVFSLAYVWAASGRRLALQNRLKPVQDSLNQVLEMTRSQQARWLAMLEGGIDLEPDDSASMEGLRQRLKQLSSMGLSASSEVSSTPTTVESTLDSLQTMLLLNHAVMADFDEVLAFYHQTYKRLREVRTQNKLNHFRLRESVEFLGGMGTQTNHYSEQVVLDVLASFREITEFSQGISREVVDRTRRLMDPHNEESLDAVHQQSLQIVAIMDHFFGEMARSTELGERAQKENLVQMDRVKVMAQAIEDFSENIRMISLNLNIEAARAGHHGAGGNGKAFQVLAAKLSEFAVRARELANQQQQVIGLAAEVMVRSSDEDQQRRTALLQALAPIQDRLAPFSRIVTKTFEEFGAVEKTMVHMSSAIENRLQAVIGKFQFQDLVRQEQEHLLEMFHFIRDQAELGAESLGRLGEVEKLRAWNDLLHTFECLATTANERIVIEEYRKKHPHLSQDGECSDLTAGSVELF